MNKFKIFKLDGFWQEFIPEVAKFPGGEIRVNLRNNVQILECRIEALLFNSDDIMTLVMLVDALREQGAEKIRLTMPYIPYARQDRVCNAGESFSIRAFARIINSLNFASVVVYDAHSDVSVALIDRCINVPKQTLMLDHLPLMTWLTRDDLIRVKGETEYPVYLVSPDAGAVKKSYEVAKAFPQIKGIIFAEKVRDVATGKILKTVVRDMPEDIAEARLLIADDICDGGRTFIELGKILRPYCKELSLYVTHGIFSQGMEVFDPFFEHVWSTTNFNDRIVPV